MIFLPRWSFPLAALCALATGCAQAPEPVRGPRPVVVETPQPLGGPAGIEAFAGTLRARNEADLSFRVPGKIQSRNVELGSRVKAGTVLAVLDPQDAQLNLDAAKAAVEAAQADTWLARNEAQRYRDLKARGHVGQSAVDQRENALRLSEAKLDQARSQLNLAQNQSRYTRLTADADGVITQLMAETGNVVAAGQPVVHFAADGEREVQIAVPEGRVEALRQAGMLGITLYSQPGKRYPGKLRDITPQADRATRTYEARVTLMDPAADLPLGASATVIVAAAADGKTFQLPAPALGQLDKDHPVVWKAIDDGKGGVSAQPVPVQVQQYLDGIVVVSGDLSPSDRLITAGVNLLRPGMAVRPVERTARAAL